MVSVERAVHDRRLYFQLRPSRLARIFGATIENIPKQTYLFADPALTAQWAETMQALPAGLNVGLVWSGNLYRNASHVALRESRRSLSFAQYAPLFEVAKGEFISLQKGDAVDQCRFRTVPLHDWTSRLDDFADTAGLIANLDLVISVDTAVVHLAAALGKPVWSLNRYDSCSPWLQGRQIPWYDNAREFRQPTWGDWDTVLQRVCTELKKCASGAQTPDAPWSRS
jgi:hypothetical protein